MVESESRNGTGIGGSMLDSPVGLVPIPFSSLLSNPAASRAATNAVRPFASFFLLGSGTVIKTPCGPTRGPVTGRKAELFPTSDSLLEFN